jgi:hypothetical protein
MCWFRAVSLPPEAKILAAAVLTLSLSGLSAPALATPMSVGASAFSPSATLIDFQIPDDVPITTQFASLGVTFGPGLVGAATTAIGGAGNLGASNFTAPSACPCDPIVVDFAQPMARVGMLFLTNNNDDTDILVFRASGSGFVQTGSFPFVTQVNEIFIGIEDTMTGIDRIEIDVTNNVNGAFIMDLFRFEPLVTPEPGTAALLTAGGLAAAWTRRRTVRA